MAKSRTNAGARHPKFVAQMGKGKKAPSTRKPMPAGLAKRLGRKR